MAVCPNCKTKLHIWNVKAECPKCGVNIPNFDWENRLEEDADIAEKAFAKFNRSVQAFKTSFVGSKMRIARIPVSVLPLFSFLFPLGYMKFAMPFFDKGITLNAITIVQNLMNVDLIWLLKAPFSDVIGIGATYLVVSLGLTLLSALSLLISLCFLLLNYRNFKSKGLFFTNLAASVMMSAGTVSFYLFSQMVEKSTLCEALIIRNGWGAILSAVLFLASAVINLIVAKQPVNEE